MSRWSAPEEEAFTTLALSYQTGSLQARDLLWLAIGPWLVNIARRRARAMQNPLDADDAGQEAWIAFAHAARRWPTGSGRLTSYLATAVSRYTLDRCLAMMRQGRPDPRREYADWHSGNAYDDQDLAGSDSALDLVGFLDHCHPAHRHLALHLLRQDGDVGRTAIALACTKNWLHKRRRALAAAYRTWQQEGETHAPAPH